MVRIIIIDDHGIIRDGIKALLSHENNLMVVNEAENGRDGLRLMNQGDWDVALLDINLPDMDGIEVVRQARARGCQQPILILTMHQEDYLATKSLQVGANGFVDKQILAGELIKAIYTVASGKRYLSEWMHEKLAHKLIDHKSNQPHELLSPRERNILRMIARGYTISGIAEELNLSTSTVTTYRRRIKEKLAIEGSTAELVRYALDHDLG
ncbi:MAG: response regulator transcription factor [Magnetococcales bacterium]|nr:response regulator transcription factor [Magnetococcales bacterium]NGZ25471.1 response regulator transcription factor [Magnetococcales bacterium]